MGSRPGGRARSDGGRGARGPRGRSTARSVPALLLLATGSLLLHLLLAGPAPPGAAAQPQPGALPGPEAGRARPLPRCATALVASDACKVRPADGKLVFRDPTVTVQRDGGEAVEWRLRRFVSRYMESQYRGSNRSGSKLSNQIAQMTNFAGRAVDATVDPIGGESPGISGGWDADVVVIKFHNVIQDLLGHPVLALLATLTVPMYCNYYGCGVFLFKKLKKRSGTPKLVFKLPEVNWPDLDALAPESPGACTMQFRTPCDEDAESDVRD